MLRKFITSTVLLTLSLLLIIALWHGIQFIRFIHKPLLTATSQNTQYAFIVDLPSGMNMRQFARLLQQRGVLTHPHYFVLYARFTQQANRLQAGEYALSYQATPAMVLAKLTQGDVIQHHLTIIEGWTVTDLISALVDDPNLEHTQTPMQLLDDLHKRLAIPHTILEGLFYPDTYAFPKGTRDIDFLQRAYQQLQQQLADAWDARAKDLPYQTPYQALIVASLIEKEANIAEEKPLVASVIINRLHAHMPLQIDAAVLYGVNQKLEMPKLTLTRTDLRSDTPYNTYLHRGLPPAPIALVSQETLQAAMHPAQSEYYYYVAKGDGSHYFSKNLKQHHQAVLIYRATVASAKEP